MWPGPFGATISTSMSGRGSIRLKCTLRPCANISAAPSFMLACEVVAVDVGLQLVGGEHHHHVGPFRGLGDLHHRQLLLLGLRGRGGALAQRDRDVLDAGVAQVQRVGMALAAVADDGDLLALDQVDVGVAIVIDAHGSSLFSDCAKAARGGGRSVMRALLAAGGGEGKPARGYGIYTLLAESSLLLPLVGRTDSAEGRARRGSPGMEHLTDEGPSPFRGRA